MKQVQKAREDSEGTMFCNSIIIGDRTFLLDIITLLRLFPEQCPPSPLEMCFITEKQYCYSSLCCWLPLVSVVVVVFLFVYERTPLPSVKICVANRG